ncbi:hypothetical protein CCAX7_11530 [Capsulimonas corticalis]|uniref:Uncharacterized protein n=1 Tax=Capsulimonas corticalis TaxID=2219043 RepID=A0A402CUV2_9BACT|nr:hypothetical protein [Capsulimonas corticalis]BDI29102.1 hypothetical protein CCAX7_11530 [Capsulimonas corticalis]
MTPEHQFPMTSEDRNPRKTLATLAARHEVAIVVFRPGLPMQKLISAIAPEEFQLRFYAPPLALSLNRYPAGFFPAIGVTAIVLCASLTIHDQHVAGIAGLRDGVVHLDVEDSGYADLAIHHEIFHFFDAHSDTFDCDEEWEAVYLAGLKYGPQAWRGRASSEPMSDFTSASGFVSVNAAVNANEDKADTFASLMTDWARVTRLSKTDPLIKRKIDLIHKRMSGSPASFDENFWRKAVEFDRRG